MILSLALTTLFVGCRETIPTSDKQPSSKDASSGAEDKGSHQPTFAYDAEDCVPCHATSLPAPTPWNAAAVLPDLYGRRPLPKAGQPGQSDRVPLDTTWSEWEAAQPLLVKKDSAYAKTCESCHKLDESGEPPRQPKWIAPVPVSAAAKQLHPTLSTPDDALERTFGIWVSATTHRTIVIVTVKVLNYGAGHRAPTRFGELVTMELDVTDAEGRPLKLLKGRTLEDEPTQPGFRYARTYIDKEGRRSLSPDNAVAVAGDTRLTAGEHDEFKFDFLLPESAPDEGIAWKARGRLIWRPRPGANTSRVLEEDEVTSPQ